MTHNTEDFDKKVFNDAKIRVLENIPDFSYLNIAVIGKVSSGKSSLINALLQLSRKQALNIAKVGAKSGVTTDVRHLELDDRVCLVDSPGLDDIRNENSKKTEQFLRNIDIGIFVVNGSSDKSQKEYLNDLKKHCQSVFVVLNKIDQWDDLENYDDVVQQWKEDLNIDKIYRTCTNGYDPKSRKTKLDIRGVYSLRVDILNFLEKKGKSILLERHMADKRAFASTIIATAIMAVSAQVVLPGSAVLMVGTQTVAIISLYYLYTGEVLPATSALTLLPTFFGEESLAQTALFFQSFLPPTGVFDAAAAGVAGMTTLALLAAVNEMLANGHELQQKEAFLLEYKFFRSKTDQTIKNMAKTGVGNVTRQSDLVYGFLSKD